MEPRVLKLEKKIYKKALEKKKKRKGKKIPAFKAKGCGQKKFWGGGPESLPYNFRNKSSPKFILKEQLSFLKWKQSFFGEKNLNVFSP